LRDLRDEEEGVFIQGREIVSASFLPPAYELRAFFLQSHTLTTSSGAKQYLPLPPSFSLLLLVHYHPSGFSEMHALGNSGAGGEILFSLLGKRKMGLGREIIEKQSKGMAIFFRFNFPSSLLPTKAICSKSEKPRARLTLETFDLTPHSRASCKDLEEEERRPTVRINEIRFPKFKNVTHM
jgi:hypothetical protein